MVLFFFFAWIGMQNFANFAKHYKSMIHAILKSGEQTYVSVVTVVRRHHGYFTRSLSCRGLKKRTVK